MEFTTFAGAFLGDFGDVVLDCLVAIKYYFRIIYFSSSSPVWTIDIEITLSLSLSFVRMTPCATRPVSRTHLRGLRTVIPDFVTRTKSAFFFSSSLSIVAETIFPVFGVMAPTLTPEPPRP